MSDSKSSELDRVHEELAATEARMTWLTHEGRDVTEIKAEVEALRARLAELREAEKRTPTT